MDRVVESLKGTNERELTRPCPDKEMVVEGQKVTPSQVKRYMRRKNISVISQSDTNDDVLMPGLRSDHPGQLLDAYTAMRFTLEDLSQDPDLSDFCFPSFPTLDGECSLVRFCYDTVVTPLATDRTATIWPFPQSLPPSFPPQAFAPIQDPYNYPIYPIPETSERRSFKFPERHNYGHLSNNVGDVPGPLRSKAPALTVEADTDDGQSCSGSSKRRRYGDWTDSFSQKRLFACPYTKFDPIRFSDKNVHGKKFRSCSSVHANHKPSEVSSRLSFPPYR
jgi:hypothetical protein